MPKDIRLRIANFVGRNTNAQHTLHANLQRQLEAAKSGFTADALFDPLLTGGDPTGVLTEAQQIRRSGEYAAMSPTERFYAHGLLYMGWIDRPVVPGTDEPNRFAYRGFPTELYAKLVVALDFQHELAQTLVVMLAGMLDEPTCVENVAIIIEKVLQSTQERETFDGLWNALSNSLLKEGTPRRIRDALLDQKHRFYPHFMLNIDNTEEDHEDFQNFQEEEETTNQNMLSGIIGHDTDKLDILCEITNNGAPGILRAYEEFDTENFLYVTASNSSRALLEFMSAPGGISDLGEWLTRVSTLSKRLEEADDLVHVVKTFAEKVLPHLTAHQESENISRTCVEGLKETFLRLFIKLPSIERAGVLRFLHEKHISFGQKNVPSEISLFNRVFSGCTKDELFVSELQKLSLSSPTTVLSRTLQMASDDKTKISIALIFLRLLGYEGTNYPISILMSTVTNPSSSLLAALANSGLGDAEYAISRVMEKQEWNDFIKLQFLNNFIRRMTTSFQEKDFCAITHLIDEVMKNTVTLRELGVKQETFELLEAISEKAPDLRVGVKHSETYDEWKKEHILGGLFPTEFMPPQPKQQKTEPQKPTQVSFPCWLMKPDDERGPLQTKSLNQFERIFDFVDACTLSDDLAETLPERLNALRGVPPVPLIIATEAFRRNILLAATCILSRATEKEFKRFTDISLPKLVSHGLYAPEQFDGISEKFLVDCAVFQSLWLLSTPAIVSQLSPNYFLEQDFFPCVTNLIKHLSRRLVLHAQDDFVSAFRLACSLYTIPLFRQGTPERTKMRASNEEQIRILCLSIIKTAHDGSADRIKKEILTEIIQSTVPDGICRRELEAAIDKN